jgi:hypothetical protein
MGSSSLGFAAPASLDARGQGAAGRDLRRVALRHSGLLDVRNTRALMQSPVAHAAASANYRRRFSSADGPIVAYFAGPSPAAFCEAFPVLFDNVG